MPVHGAVTHHIPGRLRLKFTAAKGRQEALSPIADYLAAIAGVEKVQINPLTGTILVVYDPALNGQFAETIRAESAVNELFTVNHTPGPSAPADRDQPAALPFDDERSTSAVLIKEILRGIDVQLKQATGNKLDLGVLVPLTAALAALGKSRSVEGTPLWLTLGIFALQSFLTLNSGIVPPKDRK